MYCVHCGEKLEEKNKICTSCGKEVANGKTYIKQIVTDLAMKSKKIVDTLKSKKTNKYIKNPKIIVAVVIITLIILPMMIIRDTPKKAIEEYFKNMTSGNHRKCAEFIHVVGSEREIYELTESFVEEIEYLERTNVGFRNEIRNLKLMDVEIVSKSKNSCIASVTIRDSDGIQNMDVRLLKIDGRWKFDPDFGGFLY